MHTSLNNAGNKVISSVKANKKNIIVIVNDKRIAVSRDTYTELNLYKGKRLLDDTYKELRRLERLDKEIKYSRNICSRKIRNEVDVRNRLLKRNVSQKDTDYIIALLKKSNLLNDEQYTIELIEHLNSKLYGKLRIENELKQKGISIELIKQHEIDSKREVEKLNILYPKIFNKYLKKYDKFQAKFKTVNYLISKGYRIQDIQNIGGEEL